MQWNGIKGTVFMRVPSILCYLWPQLIAVRAVKICQQGETPIHDFIQNSTCLSVDDFFRMDRHWALALMCEEY